MLIFPGFESLAYRQGSAPGPARVHRAGNAERFSLRVAHSHDVLHGRIPALIAVSREIGQVAIFRDGGSWI